MIVLFFDTETTGIKTWNDPDFIPELVQIGAILQDTETKRVLAEINLIAEPVHEIPPEASRIHGITNEMAKEFKIGLNVIDTVFAQMLSKAELIVAHNIDFDLDVLKDNLAYSKRILNDYRPKKYCTMEHSLMLVKAPLTYKQKAYFSSKGQKPDAPYKQPNLSETYRFFFNEDFVGAHDAMADIRACRDIYFKLIELNK